MCNYYDDVQALSDYVEKEFPRMTPEINPNLSLEQFREANSKYYGARQALIMCSNNMLKDPMLILDQLEQKYEMTSLWDTKQVINKMHFSNAAKAVRQMYWYLSERRK